MNLNYNARTPENYINNRLLYSLALYITVEFKNPEVRPTCHTLIGHFCVGQIRVLSDKSDI